LPLNCTVWFMHIDKRRLYKW